MLTPLQNSNVFHIGGGIYFGKGCYDSEGYEQGPTIYVTESEGQVLTDVGEIKSGRKIIRQETLSYDVFSCLIACMSNRGKINQVWKDALEFLKAK